MNRIYKIVWSKAKNAYVVTSELAKNHTKSASGKAVKAALAAAVGMGLLMGGYTASAADNTPGAGSGVAVGTGTRRKRKMWLLAKMQLFPIQVAWECRPPEIL